MCIYTVYLYIFLLYLSCILSYIDPIFLVFPYILNSLSLIPAWWIIFYTIYIIYFITVLSEYSCTATRTVMLTFSC